MRITAIIAEYNPLHNGHVMHIKAAKRDTASDYVIAVMSGSYVQRGAPAIISKYERTKHALIAGADLVIELPHYYSSGSLEYFAAGAVSLIAAAGIADCISFGSECGDISVLNDAADVLHELNSSPDPAVRYRLSQGLSYSSSINLSPRIPNHIRQVLSTPNNLLASSYIAAAKDLDFKCDFHTMKRIGSAYHDDTEGALSSSSIRRELLSRSTAVFYKTSHKDMIVPSKTDSFHGILDGRVPNDVNASLLEYLNAYPPMSENAFSLLLFAKIQDIIRTADCTGNDPAKSFMSYLDVSGNLAGRIINEYAHAPSFTDLCERIKSKDINYSRISRALMHILLDIRKERMNGYVSEGYNYYIKILGFRSGASGLMHSLKKSSALPLISKNADAERILKAHYMSDDKCCLYDNAIRMFNEGTAADELYNKTACTMCGRPFVSEYEHSPVILP